MKACYIISVVTVFRFGGNCLHWESFYVMCSILLYKEPLYFFIICFELCVFLCVKHSVFIFRGNRLRCESFYVKCSILGYKEPLCFFSCFYAFVFCVLSRVCLYLGVTASSGRVL